MNTFNASGSDATAGGAAANAFAIDRVIGIGEVDSVFPPIEAWTGRLTEPLPVPVTVTPSVESGSLRSWFSDRSVAGNCTVAAAERLALLRPRMRVLYLSGYTDDAVVQHHVLDEDAPFLQKPFAPAVLAQKVREVLDR